jgi:hypothetical protein
MVDDAERRWPALMDERTAAEYLGLSIGSLRLLLRRLRIEPLPLGLRVKRWRRADIDEVIARLPFTRRSLFADSCASSETGVDCALLAVERRVQVRRRRQKPH